MPSGPAIRSAGRAQRRCWNQRTTRGVRLGLLAVLHEVRTADFSYFRSVLQVTDGNLGQHIEILRRNGLVEVTKGYEGKRPRTWVAITRAGDKALRSEIDALKRLLTL